VNYKLRNRFIGAGLAYSVGVYGLGEYMGWWDKYEIGLGHDNVETFVNRTQVEDEQSWLRWSFKLMDRSQESSKAFVDKKFVQNLPLGMQHFINDPKYQMDYVKKVELGLIKPDEESKTVEIYDNAPGRAPSKIKPEDLVSITSSVKPTES